MLKQILMRAQKEQSCRASFYCLREYTYQHEQNVARHMSVNGTSCDLSDTGSQTQTGMEAR